MIIEIERGTAKGSVTAPPSKSISHRALICAAMCKGESTIHNLSLCDDVLRTIDCLRTLGVKIDLCGNSAKVYGIDFSKTKPSGILDCGESGSTLRFLISLAMLSGEEVVFTGSRRLMERSLKVYEEIAKECGLYFSKSDGKLTVKGPLDAREYFIDGRISSQFMSGLLFALSTMWADSKIIVNSKIESRPYLDLTISVMKEFGVRIYWDTDYSTMIFGAQEYKPREFSVEGDMSSAAFIHALNLFGGKVRIKGLNKKSLQGDRLYKKYFSMLKEDFSEIDISNCPDLGPILFTVAAAKNGGKFTGTKRLRDKESDRVASMVSELSKFGAEFTVEDDALTVKKSKLHMPSEVICGHNDHRIVMSLAVICTLFGGKIDGVEAVKKSYPEFFEALEKLGISIKYIE